MPAFTRYSDPALNTFKKSNMFYETDPFIRYQDPTYLGFKLFFLFDQPESGLLSSKDLNNTAMGYLLKIGDTARAAYLKSFVDLLKRINQETPWFFQAIEGLDEAWKHGYQEATHVPLLKDKKITINCLDESIDLRITALMDLYRKACFDWEYRREVVPANLRRFKVAIYCYEGRNLNRFGWPFSPSTLGAQAEALIPAELKQGKLEMDKYFGKSQIDNSLIGAISSSLSEPNPTPKSVAGSAQERKQDYIDPNISRVMFNFEYCEFLPDESNTVFASLSHAAWDRKAQKIVFKYGNVKEDNIFRFFHKASVTDMPILARFFDELANDKPDYLDKIPKGLQSYVNGAIARGVSEVYGAVSGGLNSLLLGNVYGFNAAGVAQSVLNGGITGVISAADQIGQNASLRKAKNADIENGDLDNPLTTFSAASGDGIAYNSSLVNDKNSNPSTDQGTGNPNASLSNNTGQLKKKFGAGRFFDDFIPSIGNGNGPDSTEQGSSPENASLGNAKNSNPSSDQGSPIENASLGNAKNSNPSTNQGVSPENTSLSNDNGPDSTDQGSPNGNVSLSNSKNSKPATDQGSPNINASLNNDNGPDSTDQGSPNGNVSLNNDSKPII